MPDTLEDWSHRLSERMASAVRMCTNEEELRLAVHNLVVSAGSALFGISEWPNAERAPGRGSRRAYDNLYGGTVVEWEWDMSDSRRQVGAKQGLDYLEEMRRSNAEDRAFTAVVCDGVRWGFLVVDPAEQVGLFDRTPESAADYYVWEPNSPAACRRFLQLVGTYRKQPITARTLNREFGPASEHARRLLILLAETLAARQEGSRSDILYREWRRALDVVYGNLDAQSGDIADIFVNTYGLQLSRPVGEYLYVLHTYFALVARLIAVEMLAIAVEDTSWRPTQWVAAAPEEIASRIEALERGELPGALQISNLFEADVFSWWTSELTGNVGLKDALLGLFDALSGFAFPRAVLGPNVAADVLSDLYQSIVPPQLRKKLGEFLTPQWLAEACLERLGRLGAPLDDGRVLDPTCGTGTFLVPVLSKKLSRLRGGPASATEVQAVLDEVAGIDINPVSVIATRVNFVVALGPLAGLGSLTLRVWRADSLLVPDAPPIQGRWEHGDLLGMEFRELATSLPESFPVPALLHTSEHIATLAQLISEATDEPSDEAGCGHVEAGLSARYGPASPQPVTTNLDRWREELYVASELCRRIRRLHANGQNGVWAQIIANAYAPLFAGRFDVVVGNPPWLAWGKLPDSWRRGSERIWRRYGLWTLPPVPGERRRSFQVSDLATLVFAVAVERYAGEDGYIGLLTPISLLTADPGGRAFRRFRLVSEDTQEGSAERVDLPFAVSYVDDWSEVKPFQPIAANKPVFIVARKGKEVEYPVAASRWTRDTPRSRLTGSWREVRALLSDGAGSYKHANPGVPTSSWSFRHQGHGPMLTGGTNRWDFGKGLDTRGANGVFFVSIVRRTSAGTVILRNEPSEGRNPAVQQRSGEVEAETVFPLLRGRDVDVWHSTPSMYCLVAHDPANFDRPCPASDLAPGGRLDLAGRWLRLHRDVLAARVPPPTRNWEVGQLSGPDWYRIDGPLGHMRSGCLVVVREIAGAPKAAVVTSRYDRMLSRSELPLVDHKLLFCSVGTLEEAVYLAAYINSTPAQEFLTSFASTTGFSPRALKTLPIPPHDQGVAEIAELVEHGLAIVGASAGAQRSSEIEDRRGFMDAAVLRLAHIDPTSFSESGQSRTRRRASNDEQSAASMQAGLFAEGDV